MKILKNRTKIRISECNTKFIWILPNGSIFGTAKNIKKYSVIKIPYDLLVRQSAKLVSVSSENIGRGAYELSRIDCEGVVYANNNLKVAYSL